jgi:uncharacterized protein DUF3800
VHILFIDESGTAPGPTSVKHKYFVIGGIIVPEGKWSKLRDLLVGLKIRRKIRGEIKWRYFAPGNTQAENPIRDRSQNERDEIRTEIYEKIVCADRSVKTIACVTCVAAAYERPSITEREDIYQYTYKPISERFQYHLQDLTREVGRPEYGLIVSDHRGHEDDKRFRSHHEELLHAGGDFTSKYHNLVESLFFVPSDLSIGIQLADMVAGAIWRKFEVRSDRWYRMLEPSLRCSKQGEVDGYGIIRFPKSTWR